MNTINTFNLYYKGDLVLESVYWDDIVIKLGEEAWHKDDVDIEENK